MRLEELQRTFSQSVRGARANALPVTGEGLRVYRNNYREQLRAALRSSFPYLHSWLGDFEFDQAAEAHVARSAPRSWTLDEYGHDFASTLKAVFADDPELAELAWLEWAMAEALVARDEAPVDPVSLAAIDWDVARIAFVRSLRISKARSNAAEIWSALEEQSIPPAAAVREPHAVLVWRRGLTPCFRTVPVSEFEAISALNSGASFAEACEALRLSLGLDEAINFAGAMLARWISDELIACVED